jgi:hypothetical protein
MMRSCSKIVQNGQMTAPCGCPCHLLQNVNDVSGVKDAVTYEN